LDRLDALSGLILVFVSAPDALTWVAILQLPVFHRADGSGHAEQYHAEENSTFRPHPSHCSTA
jgi:hypothetical protein